MLYEEYDIDDDITYLSYSFTFYVMYNLCINTKQFSTRKWEVEGFMSENSKWQFGQPIKTIDNIFCMRGKWEMKQAEEMQNGE